MIIVTGGAGFIGSNLIRGLNEMGITDILVVDTLKNGEKHLNLNTLDFLEFLDYHDFTDWLINGKTDTPDVIFHQGACTNTMEYDGRYMMERNYDFSKAILAYCLDNDVRLIYASSAAVYGNGDGGFREARECEYPLNVYAFSKFAFDQHVRRVLDTAQVQIVGLRYFNVYGPQENHKEKMASVIYQFHRQIQANNEIRLFAGSDRFLRDFIYVQDVVDVNLFFFQHPHITGIYNCGTGKTESFQDIGELMTGAYKGSVLKTVPFPEHLREKYQTYTCADISLLRAAGYNGDFTPLKEGLKQYTDILKASSGYWMPADRDKTGH